MSLRDKANDVAEKARRYTVAHQGKIAEGIDKVEALVDVTGQVVEVAEPRFRMLRASRRGPGRG